MGGNYAQGEDSLLKSANRNLNMLEGSIADKLLLFSLPLAATGLLQQLFNAADVMVVGRFVGKNAMAAVGSNSPVVGLLVNGFVGVALGANVVISRLTGEKNDKSIEACVHTSILFALLGGVLIALAGLAGSKPLLRQMSVPEEVFPMALAYLRIYLLGLPVIFLYNFEAAILRSQGDTRTPLVCLVFSGLLNVILNLVFVLLLHMDADGVATATVLSNLASALLLLQVLRKRTDIIRLRLSRLRLNGRALKHIVKIGLPAGLQSMVFSLSNICVQSALNTLGSDVMAASSAAFNIEILAYYCLNSFGQACTTFVGQNHGANNLDRCRKVIRISLWMDIAFTEVISLLILAVGEHVLGWFNSDEQIISLGMIRLRYIVSWEVLNAIMEVLSGAMRGYGHSLTPALITFLGVCGVRILWVYTVFRSTPTFSCLMLVYPISWAVTVVGLAAAYIALAKKLKTAPHSL